MSNAREIAQLGSVPSGRKNIIINGDMRISQRGTSFSVNNAGAYTLDRFNLTDGGAGSFTVEQSTDAPDNFQNSLKITVASADTSIGASDYAWLTYVVEGYDLAHLNLGQSSARTFTLSFWVKSSVTGTFSGGFENYDGGRGYAFTYTIDAANTWEYKTVTVAGDTGGGNWKTDILAGVFILWDLGTGTDRTVPTAGSWSSSRSVGTDGGTKLVSTNGATLYLTGVQLEVGSVATEFEHRSYGEELALCQRYYQKNISTSSETSMSFCRGQAFGASSAYVYFEHPVEMRTKPTMSNSIASIGNFGALSASGGGCSISGLTYVSAWSSKWTSTLSLTVAVGTFSAGQATEIDAGGNSNAFLAFDAEL